jgi:hypothetical protein
VRTDAFLGRHLKSHSDDFTKTGSGQTQDKLKKQQGVFCLFFLFCRGESYYYNSVTQETTWDPPAGLFTQEAAAAAAAAAAAGEASAAPVSEAAAESDSVAAGARADAGAVPSMAGTVSTAVVVEKCKVRTLRKRLHFALPFCTRNGQFTKTGSGQI